MQKKILLIASLLVLSLACSLFSASSPAENLSPAPIETNANNEPTSPSDLSPSDSLPSTDSSPSIPAADSAIGIDCNLFVLENFNAITETEYSLVTQNDGACIYKSTGGGLLTIGGGGPIDVEKAKKIFEMTYSIVPNAKWEVYEEGFQLGTAVSTATVTGQGISASGNSMLIIAGEAPSGDVDAMQSKLVKLVEEAARQLNEQW